MKNIFFSFKFRSSSDFKIRTDPNSTAKFPSNFDLNFNVKTTYLKNNWIRYYFSFN